MAVDVVGVKYEGDTADLRKQLDALIAENKRLLGAVDGVGKEYNTTSKKATSNLKEVQKETEKVSKSTVAIQGAMNRTAQAVAAAFTVDAIISFGKQVLDVTGKFQRYAAVLENTLGSKSAAQKALVMIQDFASQTPFSVDQLTDSFIKLTNSGFQPTQEEMRKLGDLASSQGKQFDQLAEAVIDAQTGEFERLKEFGIRATKEGDQVKFSFKGVETQTQFTTQAIQDYVLSLGDLEGVAGGMDAISKTIEGKISNLGDSWGQFLNNIGNQSSGIFFEVVEAFSNSLTYMNAILETEQQKLLKTQEDAKESALNQSQGWRDEELEMLIAELGKQRAVLMDEYRIAQKAGDEFRISELAKEFDYLATQEQGFKDVLADRQKQRVEDQKNAEKDAERRRIAGEKALRDAQKLEQELLKTQFETQALRIELMEDGIGKQLLARNLAFEKEKNQYRDNKEALLLIEEKYQRDVRKIIEDNRVKTIEREEDLEKTVTEKREEESEKQLELAQEGIARWNEANDAKKERDKKREEQAAEDRIAIEEATMSTLSSIGDLFIQDQKKRSTFQKALALFQLGLDTAKAISAGVASASGVPFPGNLIAIATTVATVLANVVQAKNILSKAQPPGYAEGVVELQGPGTSKSDSIPARLSRGESVITAERTKQYKQELTEMMYGDYEALILKKHVLPALREDRKQRDMASSMAAAIQLQNIFDDTRMVDAITRNKPATSKDIKGLGDQLGQSFKEAAYRNSKTWKG